ncbi:hypothetical protein GOL35_20350 [Sinorhizobium medicae]|nr:hypothetical protein [Sinorhizobium medicae]MDX0839921.1 hypothetical protein [Sinorhizobium medicae]MDX1107914.1 hypothetical protein [Sinorhizobium medicae]MDX1120680.1 hypothetical protein [Sinorhizobium medicae]
MVFRDTWKRMNWLRVAGIVSLVYATWIVWVLGWERIRGFFQNTETELNAVGDFLAGTFAPVALIWLCAAVFTQRQELNDTRDQFAENKRVTDEQLKVIQSQNALLSLQHNQAVENAKQAYRLSLFDKRYQIYEKFIKFGEAHDHKDYDEESYWAMTNLAQEAAFVFDKSIEDWLGDIAQQIADYVAFKEEKPLRKGDPVYGTTDALGDERHNRELEKQYMSLTGWITEQFLPDERTGKFWRFMSVSDYAEG